MAGSCADLEGCPVLQAQRLQRMADGWPQVLPTLEGRAQESHVCPAPSCDRFEHTALSELPLQSHNNMTRLSGSDNVFDLHMAARPISDLNNICFVIDALNKGGGNIRHGSGT
jgi:hypothetical protein